MLYFNRNCQNIYREMIKLRFDSVTPHFNVIDNVDDFESGYISSKGKSDKKLFQELENYSYPYARMFNLCAIDEAQKLLDKN